MFLRSDWFCQAPYKVKTIPIKEAIKTKKEVFLVNYHMTATKKIAFENHIQYDEVLEVIFSPPPEVY